MVSLLHVLPGSIAQGLIWGILAISVFLTFKVLDYADMTVDGSFCTGGATTVMMMLAGHNVYVALLCGTIAGMCAGYVTGLLHTMLKIPPILSGILTQLGLYSVNLAIMGKSNQAISVDQYALLVSLRFINYSIIMSVIVVVVIITLLYLFFGSEIGSAIRATGCNQNMARAQGINTGRCIRIGLVVSNGLTAFAGGMYAQYQGNADVNAGRGAIVIGLAAVIIGEVIFGTRHNFALRMAFSVCGAIIYYIVIAVVLQLGLPSTYLKLLSAVLVAIFLGIPAIQGYLGIKSRQS
ncbi:MAG: ABC transporter permease [Butyrivibrio sp.]|nr:ABC transporter permease [Butyrivibrio sp.]